MSNSSVIGGGLFGDTECLELARRARVAPLETTIMPFMRSLTAGRPLVPVDVAMFVLDLADHDQVLAQIETGEIGWAWDISSPGAERREVRIFWACLLTAPAARASRAERDVYSQVVPSHWGRVRASSLYRRFACSQELIARLITAGAFVPLTNASRGPDGSPEVTRDSVIRFLQSRKL